MKYDVFISYSRKDTVIAEKICKALDEAAITYFIDRQGIAGGLEFPKVIANAILDSRLFLFLASNNSYMSKFTNSEITFAFNKKPKESIIPYIIDDSHLPVHLEFVFSSINFRTLKDHPITSTLIEDIKRLLDKAHCDIPTTGSSLGNSSVFKYFINSVLMLLVAIEFLWIAIKGYAEVIVFWKFFSVISILCLVLTIIGYTKPGILQFRNRMHVTFLYLLPTFVAFALYYNVQKYSYASAKIDLSTLNLDSVEFHKANSTSQADSFVRNTLSHNDDASNKKTNESKQNLTNSIDNRDTPSTTPQLSDEESLVLALRSSGSEQEQLLLKLANKGYSKAFIPLSKYYLSNPSTHNKADKWANKAKDKYPREANQIIDCLKEYGYYE